MQKLDQQNITVTFFQYRKVFYKTIAQVMAISRRGKSGYDANFWPYFSERR